MGKKWMVCRRARGLEWGMNLPKLYRVFHPSDFSEGDLPAFAHALRIAVAARGTLNLLHVAPKGSSADWNNFPSSTQTLKEWGLLPMDAQRDALAELGLGVRKVERAGDDPVAEIADHIRRHETDLVVLSTHQRQGLSRWTHSSIAEKTAHKTRAMTLFVPRRVQGFVSRETGAINLRNIFVPLAKAPDPTLSVAAAAAVAELLTPLEVKFHLFHAGAEEDMPATPRLDKPGWAWERTAWEGDPVEHILNAAEEREADLIVMATRGHHEFLDALRGSVTERVLRGARCPVLAVPA